MDNFFERFPDLKCCENDIEKGLKLIIETYKNKGKDIWEVLTRPGRKAIPGARFEFGDKLKAGQTIILSGATGIGSGPHLHFEVLINGSNVNPKTWLQQ